jgi:hypothetical protein
MIFSYIKDKATEAASLDGLRLVFRNQKQYLTFVLLVELQRLETLKDSNAARVLPLDRSIGTTTFVAVIIRNKLIVFASQFDQQSHETQAESNREHLFSPKHV